MALTRTTFNFLCRQLSNTQIAVLWKVGLIIQVKQNVGLSISGVEPADPSLPRTLNKQI